jgi:hypothetical protein
LGRILSQAYYLNGSPHRENGPQFEAFDPETGVLLVQEWRQKGQLHRENGPAQLRWDADGKLMVCAYYKEGATVAAFQSPFKPLIPSPSCTAVAARAPGRNPSPA